MNHEAIQLANATKHICEILWNNLQEQMGFSSARKLVECEPKYGRAVWEALYSDLKKIRPVSGRGMGSMVIMTMPVAPSNIIDYVGKRANSVKSVIADAKAYLLQPSNEDIEVMEREGYDVSNIQRAAEDDDLADNFQPKVIDGPAPAEEKNEEPAKEEKPQRSREEVIEDIKHSIDVIMTSEGCEDVQAEIIAYCVENLPAQVLYDELKRRGFDGLMKRVITETLE